MKEIYVNCLSQQLVWMNAVNPDAFHTGTANQIKIQRNCRGGISLGNLRLI